MKLRRLEMLLEQVTGFANPRPDREQYQTPAPLAARLLYTAFLAGDITNLRILELGSGTGILGIGSALLGAGEVIGVELDPDANKIAEQNAADLGVAIELIRADIADTGSWNIVPFADTVIMNPPFGAQKEHADRPFIDLALARAEVVYGIFNAGSESFLIEYIRDRADIIGVIAAEFTIPRTFFFHTDDRRDIPVEIIIFRKTR
ncbi:MAG: METTL5 family protein [Methanospirillum sp.]|uniref:METTL5 family protein n=1 Tax=Methanospirillum sp. TaxID=45200 RepID=UPI00236D646F|nr:METTL5 family protein [Methanospirillum sp.]MDD1727828.1 METTL5 family protein [Methanospirillum sp.]